MGGTLKKTKLITYDYGGISSCNISQEQSSRIHQKLLKDIL